MTTILIVDDEAAIVELLQLVLEDAGYRVLTAISGHDAWAVLATQRPDAILTDFMMPGMTGVELAQAVHDDAALAGIPLVMMSAVRLPQPRNGLWRAELPKPWRMEHVLSMVAALTGGPKLP